MFKFRASSWAALSGGAYGAAIVTLLVWFIGMTGAVVPSNVEAALGVIITGIFAMLGAAASDHTPPPGWTPPDKPALPAEGEKTNA